MLIDTNIYIEFLRGNPEVEGIFNTAEVIALSTISIGELLAGFRISVKEKKHMDELDELIYSPRVVIYDIDTETSEFYSKIYSDLRAAGTPIPTNDLWIAALALQHGIKLFTLDNHFKKVPGLFLI